MNKIVYIDSEGKTWQTHLLLLNCIISENKYSGSRQIYFDIASETFQGYQAFPGQQFPKKLNRQCATATGKQQNQNRIINE